MDLRLMGVFGGKAFRKGNTLPLLILAGLVLGVAVAGRAQGPHPAFRNYDVSHGLPSSEVYQVKQDSKGYMWFATNNGVSRFNGYEFENFSMNEGLPDNTVFNIYEDASGKIWFVPYSNQLSYYSYEDDQIHLYAYNKLIQDTLKTVYLKTSFLVDEKGTVFLGMRFFGICEISKDGVLKTHSEQSPDDRALLITEPVKGELSFGTIFFNPIPPDSSHFTIRFRTSFLSKDVVLPDILALPMVVPLAIVLKSKEVAVVVYDKLLVFDEQGRYQKYAFDFRVVWIYEDSSGDLWVGTYKGGVYHVRGRDFKHMRCYLPGNFVTGVLEDRDGGFWLTTGDQAVFYTSSKEVLTYDNRSSLGGNRINGLASDGSTIYVSAEHSIVSSIDSAGRLSPFPIGDLQKHYGQEVRDLYYDPLSSRLLLSFPRAKDINLTQQGNLAVAKFYFNKIVPAKEGGYWFAVSTGIYYAKDKQVCNLNRDRKRFQHVDALVEESDTSLLLGCLNGLWRYHKTSQTYTFAGGEEPLLNQRITDLLYLRHGTLCMATKGLGLLLKNGGSLAQISMKDGLSSNNLKSLLVEDSVIWAPSDNGLNRICLDGQGRLKSIRVFSTCDGLVSNQISHVIRVGKKLWVGTDKGLSFFEPEKLRPLSSPVPVIISKLWINEATVPLQQAYTLSYGENLLRIAYIALDYKQAGRIRYRYRMEGLDTGWVYTANREVQYTTLPPGQYRFVVQVATSGGSWLAVPASVNLKILAPFWRTWWFLALMALALVSATYLLMSYLSRRKQAAMSRESENQRLLLSLKLKALRAQINPHFIFNVMNSIQHFITHHDEEAAQRYLAKFSRLIRTILNNSEENTIPLSEEIKALTLYLELENMRFEERFDYDITVDQAVDIDATQVPSMLIQPYVENAVKHGVMASGKNGRIRISLSRQQGFLKCTVEDNGVGRSGSKAAGHRSFGSSITRGRLMVLNELHKSHLSEMITDLYDAEGRPSGTRVDIYIPYAGSQQDMPLM